MCICWLIIFSELKCTVKQRKTLCNSVWMDVLYNTVGRFVMTTKLIKTLKKKALWAPTASDVWQANKPNFPGPSLFLVIREVRVASRGQEIASVASQGVRFACISCVQSCQSQAWRVASRGKELHQLHRKIWVYKMPNNWKVLTQLSCTLYTIICTHTELLNDIDNAQLLYHVTV
jgi:hypothetical protein